jgi:hypothetical protein
MTSYEALHGEAMSQYALAHHHLNRLKDVLDQMASARAFTPVSHAPVRCVREWQDYLAINGPTLKPKITDDTGIKFTERGSQYVVEWRSALREMPDDNFAPNTLMKINARSEGKRGSPPRIYFLWSQRWDVHPLFGVGPTGPVKPIDGDLSGDGDYLSADHVARAISLDTESGPAHGAPLLGVIHPPEFQSNAEPEPPTRCATMDAWDEMWAPTFDFLASAGGKPSDEQRAEMKATVPEGSDGNAAIAIAYRDAMKRLTVPIGGDLAGSTDGWSGYVDKRGWEQDPIPLAES